MGFHNNCGFHNYLCRYNIYIHIYIYIIYILETSMERTSIGDGLTLLTFKLTILTYQTLNFFSSQNIDDIEI